MLSKVTGVAKKLSHGGLGILNQFSSAQNSTPNAQPPSSSVKASTYSQYQDPRDVLKAHLPAVSRQVLGRHFQTVNRVAHFISPELNDQVSDYFFNHLNQISNELSSVDAVLDEVGIRDLEELTQDVDRSQRIGQALAEQNKWLASVQGAFSGATGIVGTAIDIPVSLMFTLRMIYQVGRSYGFDLQKEQDQEVVQYIFKQINLNLIAEKQTLLVVLKALTHTLKNHDVSQLQSLVGSDSDLEMLKRFLSNEQGELKWSWLNQFNSTQLLHKVAKLSPLASAGIGAVYSWRLVEDVHQKAQEVFSLARQYILEQKDVLDPLSPIEAYENAILKLQALTQKSTQSEITPKALSYLEAEFTPVNIVKNGEQIIEIVGEVEQVPNQREQLKMDVSSSEAELLSVQQSATKQENLNQPKQAEIESSVIEVNVESIDTAETHEQHQTSHKMNNKKASKSQAERDQSQSEK